MTGRSLSRLAAGFALLCGVAGPASATKLLTVGAAPSICRSANGGAAVDRVELARLMLSRAGIPNDLEERGRAAAREFNRRGANRDGSRRRQSMAELAYIVANASGDPFGDRRDDDGYAEAQERLKGEVRALELDFVELDGKLSAPYRLERSAVEFGTQNFLDPDNGLVVACVDAATQSGEAVGTEPDAVLKSISERFRLSVEPLGLRDPTGSRTKTLKNVDPAELSFENNIEDGATVFAVDGAAGVVLFPGAAGRAEHIMYVAYKHQSPGGTSQKPDIHHASPGYLYTFTDHLGSMPYTLSLSPSVLFDLEEESSQLRAEATAEPAFDLLGFPIGKYSRRGQLWIRPDLKLRARGASVLDAGSDGELAAADDYFAVGGIVDVRVRLPDVRPLENLTLSASFDHLQFVAGGLRRSNANRIETALSYAPPDYPYLALSLRYANGEDMDTFQREELYKLVLGLRF